MVALAKCQGVSLTSGQLGESTSSISNWELACGPGTFIHEAPPGLLTRTATTGSFLTQGKG